MKRILLDTNVVNRIVGTELNNDLQLAITSGRVLIIKTPSVRNELEQTPNLDRRTFLLSCYDQLPGEDVLDQAGIWGVAKWGQGVYGDGSHTGIAVDSVRTNMRANGARDGIIAVTASGMADILVTEDGDLRKKVQQSSARCTVWTLTDLIQHIRTETGDGQS